MNNYGIYAMGHSIKAILRILEFGIKFDDVIKFLDNIFDHSSWEIDESLFIEDEKSGSYFIWDAQDLMDDLSESEWDYFVEFLKKKFSKYNEMKELDFHSINDSFGEPEFPTWEEAYNILNKIKARANLR